MASIINQTTTELTYTKIWKTHKYVRSCEASGIKSVSRRYRSTRIAIAARLRSFSSLFIATTKSAFNYSYTYIRVASVFATASRESLWWKFVRFSIRRFCRGSVV